MDWEKQEMETAHSISGLMTLRDDHRGSIKGGVMIRSTRNLYRFAWLIILSIMLSACTPGIVPLAKVTPMTPDSMVIFATLSRNYTGTHGVLNIYVDTDGFPNALTPASGQEKKELTATIWLVIADRPQTYTSFMVHSGETISFEGYEISILRIGGNDREGYFVEVDVSEME